MGTSFCRNCLSDVKFGPELAERTTQYLLSGRSLRGRCLIEETHGGIPMKMEDTWRLSFSNNVFLLHCWKHDMWWEENEKFMNFLANTSELAIACFFVSCFSAKNVTRIEHGLSRKQ